MDLFIQTGSVRIESVSHKHRGTDHRMPEEFEAGSPIQLRLEQTRLHGHPPPRRE